MFYTDVGHGLPSLDKLTALGTMNFNKAGELEGVFDVNTEVGPFLDLSYTGNATLNNDCRGRLSFVTSDGSVRNDSFVLIGKKKIRRISVQNDVIWTYTAERISRRSNN